MGKRPFISIVIVCYNYGHLLPRALEAIARQQFRDFEIVFVDNGCTDDSLAVMQSFAAANPAIRVVYVTIEKNVGLPYGDIRGVEAASGEYLMFHDADDWMDDDTLQLLADAAKSNDADRVISAIRDVDENGRVSQIQELGKEPSYWLYSLVQGNLFRADLYKELGIQPETNSPDVEKTFRFSAHTRKAAFVFRPCYNFFVHLQSTSRRKEIYKELLSDGRYSMLLLLRNCAPYVPERGEDHTMAVYQLTRIYYGSCFHYLRDAPLRDKLHIYSRLNLEMKKLLPDYLVCTRMGLKRKKAVRPYSVRIVWLASMLEKLHLMPLGLVFYHLFSKVYYFKQ